MDTEYRQAWSEEWTRVGGSLALARDGRNVLVQEICCGEHIAIIVIEHADIEAVVAYLAKAL